MWPPLASDLTEATAKKSVPIDLYNTVAYITGLATEPVVDYFVEIQDEGLEKMVGR